MHANALWVMGGTALLGLAGGVLGAFALLRRRALLGDVLAHAALPGIALAYMATGTKAAGPLLIGATASGVLGVLAMRAITRWSRLKEDAAMSLVLTVFFGLGIMLLGWVQRMPGGNQSGLDKFLFGQAASIVPRDLQVIAVAAALLCLAILVLYKEFKLLAFDPDFGAVLGFPVVALDLLLSLCIALAVVIGLEAVGVVLMAALLTTPAVAARYWTHRLSVMVPLAGLFGAASGVVGTLASQIGPRMPTGPLIVLAASLLFFLSLLAAPHRGLLARLIRLRRAQAQASPRRPDGTPLGQAAAGPRPGDGA
ncbi:metal ABC transporter permease [Symbiobacterium thermophilum]|uniref:metal ABC transporter permease n=1 Tax=Symbiobacterium thermophilum TaxID=2734 RepID=UPI000323045F|nr:metal ABC transporter permease [Symbiobacterium thermophilum]